MGLFGFGKKKKVTPSDMERAIYLYKNSYEIIKSTGKNNISQQISEIFDEIIAKGERGELGKGNYEYDYALHAMMQVELIDFYRGRVEDSASGKYADIQLSHLGRQDRQRAVRLMREYIQCNVEIQERYEEYEMEEARKKRNSAPFVKTPYSYYEVFMLALMVEDEQKRLELMRESAKRNHAAAIYWLHERGLLKETFPDKEEFVSKLHQMYLNAGKSVEMLCGWRGYHNKLLVWIIQQAGFPDFYRESDGELFMISPSTVTDDVCKRTARLLAEWLRQQAIEALKGLDAAKYPGAASALKDCQERRKKVLEKEKRRQQQLAELKIQAEVIQRIREEEGL